MAAVRELALDGQTSIQVVIWSVLLACICLLGDQFCAAVAESSLLWRALSDSITHGAIGVMSWAVVTLPGLSMVKWMQCLLCGLLSSLIDLDHFLEARSLQLKDAVSLQHRPPFHSTTLVIATTGLLWVTSLGLDAPLLKKLSLLCFVAWFSHHLRDATRHGLWFSPFGSSLPLPYACYVAATVGVALAACFVWHVALCSVAVGTSQDSDLTSVSTA